MQGVIYHLLNPSWSTIHITDILLGPFGHSTSLCYILVVKGSKNAVIHTNGIPLERVHSCIACSLVEILHSGKVNILLESLEALTLFSIAIEPATIFHLDSVIKHCLSVSYTHGHRVSHFAYYLGIVKVTHDNSLFLCPRCTERLWDNTIVSIRICFGKLTP